MKKIILILVALLLIGCGGDTKVSQDINGTQAIVLDKNTTSVSNMVNVSDINITDNAILVICTEGSVCSVDSSTNAITTTTDNNSSS